MKFSYTPKHMGDELTVFLQLEPQEEDFCEFEIEAIETSEGEFVDFSSLHEEDIKKINELAESIANDLAHELYWESKYSMAEDYLDSFKDGT